MLDKAYTWATMLHSGGRCSWLDILDHEYVISEYWHFGRAQLQPINISLVVHGGPQGYGCYVQGNEGITKTLKAWLAT